MVVGGEWSLLGLFRPTLNAWICMLIASPFPRRRSLRGLTLAQCGVRERSDGSLHAQSDVAPPSASYRFVDRCAITVPSHGATAMKKQQTIFAAYVLLRCRPDPTTELCVVKRACGLHDTSQDQ